MIRISKVTVNIGVGNSGEELERAEKLLQKICEQKPVKTLSTKRIPNWGIRKKQPIGVKVTLRGKKAFEFLNKVLEAKERTLNAHQFDDCGNFAFGIHEYIEIPGFKYDPEIGIYGFDICVTLEKDGYRVKKRKRQRSKLPSKQRLTQEEAAEWVEKNLNVKVRKE
jgi:large subunit ribosomal protein L5